jgi:hypothetical protein
VRGNDLTTANEFRKMIDEKPTVWEEMNLHAIIDKIFFYPPVGVALLVLEHHYPRNLALVHHVERGHCLA